MYVVWSFKPVSHQPCDSRERIWVLGFVRQPQCVVNTTPQDCPTKIQGRKAAATSKTKFSTYSFSLRFRAISGDRTAAARHARLLQGTQGFRTTDVRVRHPRICLTTARSPRALLQGCRKNAAKRSTTA